MVRSILSLLVGSSVFATAATVSINFTVPGSGVFSTGFVDGGGTAGGLLWGIVADTAGDGFDGAGANSYQAGITFQAGSASGWQVTGTDDLIWFADQSLVQGSPDGPTVDTTAISGGGSSGGPGGIVSLSSLIVDEAGTPDAEVDYAIIWFDNGVNNTATATVGMNYFLQDAGALDLPAAGGVETHDLDATSVISRQFVAIPEPSSIALLGLAGLTAIGRRKRS